MKSMAMLSTVVHTLGNCLSASSLFIARLRTFNSWGTGTQKKIQCTHPSYTNMVALEMMIVPLFGTMDGRYQSSEWPF